MHVGVVVIVDDDPDVRDTLVDVLREVGIYAVAFAGARAAFDYLVRTPLRTCLVFLDWMMPEMSGSDFLRAQEADPRLAGIPTILITAAGAREIAAAREEHAGVLKDAIPKPIDLEQVFLLVARYC